MSQFMPWILRSHGMLWNSNYLDYQNSLSLDMQAGVKSCTNIHL